MFLKKIIISGFKSFADKTSLSFDRGITGIVGPNGSGKSNVIDSVRWVMGEQNAKYLRGEVATDIIFAGSEKRQGLSVAEVSLVFDNSTQSSFCPPEYQHEPEITLTRRLYIDGEREYLINKKNCRLKDIVSFFAATGLGGRSYSMIQQGQVDRILNAKPEEIRIILEEAAGTLIYKTRRDEALKKLQSTQENLARVEDIVSELTRQQDSLQAQMEKAMQWKNLNDQLKEKEVHHLEQNYLHFKNKLDTIQSSMSQELADEAEVIAQLSNFEARHAELQDQLDDSDPGLQILHEQISKIREEIARAESAILNARQRVEDHQKRLESIASEIDSDSQNIRAFEEQVSAAQEEMSHAEKELGKQQEVLDEFQFQLDAIDERAQIHQHRLNDAEDELKNMDRLLESNRLRSEAIDRDRQRNLRDQENCAERIKNLESEIKQAENNYASAKQKADESQSGLGGDIDLKAELETKILKFRQEIEEYIQQRDQIKERYFNVKARLNSLEEMELNASDLQSSIKTLSEFDSSFSQLHLGMLSDHIRFNDSSQELSTKAVSAFERWCERLVVDDLDNLHAIVRVVQQCKVGNIPVWLSTPSHLIDNEALNSWKKDNDAICFSEFLTLQTKNEIIQKILSSIFYLPALNLDESSLKNLPKGIIAFTPQGISVHSGSSIHINPSQSKGAVSRKSEIETLFAELKKEESSLGEVQASIDKLDQSLKEDQLLLQEIDTKLRDHNKDVLGVLAELQSAKQALEHKIDLKNQSQEQLKTIDDQNKLLIRELEELGETRISIGRERDQHLKTLQIEKEGCDSIEDEREEVARQMQSKKVDFAKYDARAGALRQSFQQIQDQLSRLNQGLNRKFQDQDRLKQEIDESYQIEKRSTEDIESKIKQRESLENDLLAKREENSELLEEMRVVDQKLKTLREKLNGIQKLNAEKNLEVERLRLVIAATLDQAQEKYQMEIKIESLIEDEKFDSEKSSKELNRIRSKIDQLGAINMMAIEEYNQLMERKNFIDQQRQEIISSIGVLEEALKEIEETSKDKFITTFEQINTEFSQLFPILFPGGEAKLELSQPEDPLNTGVEIMVRLPGKARQRMNLYSGGEKALTAISLIFALLKSKPTPFCFLDEVDAPLDEANVGKYNRVLQALSDRFQFIVITHNRRTMEVLDTLYGVTMQEPGVSKVVGVDMSKDLPEHLKKSFKEERILEGATAKDVSPASANRESESFENQR